MKGGGKNDEEMRKRGKGGGIGQTRQEEWGEKRGKRIKRKKRRGGSRKGRIVE